PWTHRAAAARGPPLRPGPRRGQRRGRRGAGAGRRGLPRAHPARLRLARRTLRVGGRAQRLPGDPHRGARNRRAARGAGRQCRANPASGRRAGLQPRPARRTDPRRAGRNPRRRSGRHGPAGRICPPPPRGPRTHPGDERRPGPADGQRRTAAAAAAQPGAAGAGPVAGGAGAAGRRRDGLPRRGARAVQEGLVSRGMRSDVIVVGGGVVGAACALALAGLDLEVTLVEAAEPVRWSPSRPDLRVFAFAPDNAALLDTFGAWREVLEARAQPYRRMRVWDAAGGGELAFDADAVGRGELGWIVENGLLVDRLWAALAPAGVDV